jgi:Flp pilus assembly protein TadD
VFSSQAGTFVHFLMFSNKGTRREQLHRFIAAIRNGRPQDEALRTILGDLGMLEKEYALYVRDQFFQYMTLPAETSVRRETFTVRALDAAESAARRAGFHAAFGREIEARSMLAEATKLSPNLAAVHEVDGLLLDAKRDVDAARQAYERAIAAGSSNFYVKYRWAALTWAQPAIDDSTRTRVRQALEDTATLNDRYLPTFVLLSTVRSRMGAFSEGVVAARRAVTLDPESVPIHLGLAAALWNASARDEARTVAEQALALAKTDAERLSVSNFISVIERASASQ